MSASQFHHEDITTAGRTVETPCCKARVELGFQEWQHDGYPRQADPTFVVWNLRCPTCDLWQQVGIEVRYRRALAVGKWVTFGRLVGPAHWSTTAKRAVG